MKNKDGRGIPTVKSVRRQETGLGPDSAGQSGDTQGLPDNAIADSESVTELVEEGQNLEAELILGMENTPDGEVREVRTKQDLRKDPLKDYPEKG